MRWYQLDLSGLLIATLEKLGLATDVYRIPPNLLARQARKTAAAREAAATIAEESPALAASLAE